MAKSAFYVWGPYRDSPTKYRLKLSEKGAERSICFKTLAEAEAIKAKLLLDAQAQHKRTIAEVLEEYRDDMLTRRAVKAETARDVCAELGRVLPLELPILALKPDKAESLYHAYANKPHERTGKPRSTATHQHALVLAKSFFKWAVKRGHATVNPFAGVLPIGKKSVGKPQLRVDEAQRFEAAALGMARTGDAAALGVLLMLNLGLRQGEVSARVARDVDDSGRILCVPTGKTKNASRRLKVPEHLRSLLLLQAQRRAANAFLFHEGTDLPPRSYFWTKVHQVCKSAGVPLVCPHSLRGLHATLALEAGATSDMVARALGHGSFEITARHYATAESVENSRTARVTQALNNGPGSGPDNGPGIPSLRLDANLLASLLLSLPPEELAAVLARVKAA